MELLKYVNDVLVVRCLYVCRYIIDEDSGKPSNLCCHNCHRNDICDAVCTVDKLKITNRECGNLVTTED